jgi:hypothetical protein
MRTTKQPMVYSVTTAATSSTADQDARMKRYLIMMGIRIACFGLVFVTTGWLRWACIAGAVLLPYFAVIVANAVQPRTVGSLQRVTPQDDTTHRLER